MEVKRSVEFKPGDRVKHHNAAVGDSIGTVDYTIDDDPSGEQVLAVQFDGNPAVLIKLPASQFTLLPPATRSLPQPDPTADPPESTPPTDDPTLTFQEFKIGERVRILPCGRSERLGLTGAQGVVMTAYGAPLANGNRAYGILTTTSGGRGQSRINYFWADEIELVILGEEQGNGPGPEVVEPSAENAHPVEPSAEQTPLDHSDLAASLHAKLALENKPVLVTFRTRCGCHHQMELMPPLKNIVNVPLVDYQRMPQDVLMTNELLQKLNPNPDYRVFALMLVTVKSGDGAAAPMHRFEYVELAEPKKQKFDIVRPRGALHPIGGRLRKV